VPSFACKVGKVEITWTLNNHIEIKLKELETKEKIGVEGIGM
jgi:hypothetical protein